MKYTIEGFSQKVAKDLGLDALDLIILRWFVDFKDSGNMRTEFINGEKYYWIRHKKLTDELPILSMQTNAFYRRLRKICECGVLKRVLLKENGSYTYYTLGENFIKLISTQSPSHSKSSKKTKKKSSLTKDEISSLMSDIDAYEKSAEPFDKVNNLNNLDEENLSLNTSSISSELSPSSLEQLPTSSESSPSSLKQLPTSFESSPSSLKQLPTSFEQSPSSLKQTPTSFEQSPSSLEQLPTSSEQSPSSLEQLPTSSEQPPSSLEQSPSSLESDQIINLSNKSITSQYKDDVSAEFLLSELMWTLIKKNNPTFKEPNFNDWSKAFDIILNKDNRNFQEVTELIKWIYLENGFWGTHILNPWYFRDCYEKVLARKNFETSKKNLLSQCSLYSKQSLSSKQLNQYSSSDLSEFEYM
ncbi:hypothetical protein [Clostridium sp. 1001270J_160509_D11]|uniref:hypothetical protein n=1 Tax=Clostridium sp. 1001270J_160509_D11 TaxID=2787103 RepID=UPI0018A8B502|nr:hypothetical protein [Clostridium sp. 1001270J_160509_D11]